MARFHGVVGFSTGSVETAADVFVEQVVERPYFGLVIDNTRQLELGDQINADLRVRVSISIVADEYADEQFHAIRYVVWAGQRWIVTDVAVRRPRLVLSLGGLYNGVTPAVE